MIKLLRCCSPFVRKRGRAGRLPPNLEDGLVLARQIGLTVDRGGRVDVKRTFDVVVSLPVYVASLPVQGVIALAVAKDLGRPVIFTQERPGLNGKPFKLRKFRTMRESSPGMTPADDAARLTPFGRWLRATSLDELPTLWNVVRGDMSLVGPRPLLMSYLDRYSLEQARRHEVRPGVTGLAQVRGRNSLGWDEKFALDVEYVDTRSLSMDLRILAETVITVFRRDGISHAGQATMHEFTGPRPVSE